MGAITLNALAIEVRAMRNAQKRYFELSGKARGTKHPDDSDRYQFS